MPVEFPNEYKLYFYVLVFIDQNKSLMNGVFTPRKIDQNNMHDIEHANLQKQVVVLEEFTMLCGRCFKLVYVPAKAIYEKIRIHTNGVLVYHLMIHMMSFNLKVNCGILGLSKAHNFLSF